MSSSNQNLAASPGGAVMNSLLLASACAGSWQELESLVDGETRQASSSSSATIQRASDDEEACLRASASSLLEGVTVQGDTALHVVASSSDGDGDKFLRSADIIFRKAKDLLFVQNNKGDTPLHCAAQAGNSRMLSRLTGFAEAQHRAKELLETENKLGETALHEAVRAGSSSMVNQLMEEDPELASLPRDGASPLYLAVLSGDKIIAETLHAKSAAGKLSYSGPNGQNALHAGVLRDKVMTEMLLDWKKDLTKQADQNGSTPLHIAASLWGVGVPLKPLLRAEPYQMYQPDGEGLFPIHVAATSGSYSTIETMITEYPEIAGLRDSKRRTFVHVAVEWKRSYLVASACSTPSLAWILNMRDKDGNTALHLAVQLGFSDSFCSLLMNTNVRLDLTNNNGETPLDLSWSKKPVGPSYFWNDENLVHHALKLCQARHGYHLRYDHLVRQQKSEDEVKESNKLTSSTQTLIIGPVLIATVTFGASFTLPGGYKTDGTPTLVGRYIFDAFIMANTLAFLLSTAATINLLYAGMAMAALPIRRGHFNTSAYITFCSITSFGTAFVLGTYLILAPVAHMTAIAICASAFLVSLFHYKDPLRGIAIARALLPRMGSKAFFVMAHIISLRTLVIYWPLVIIFGWTAISTKYGI